MSLRLLTGAADKGYVTNGLRGSATQPVLRGAWMAGRREARVRPTVAGAGECEDGAVRLHGWQGAVGRGPQEA